MQLLQRLLGVFTDGVCSNAAERRR